MWSFLVVVTSPGLDQDLGLGAASEPLEAQALVAKLVVEVLVGAILPRTAGVDQRCIDPHSGEPLQDCAGDEFRSIVRAKKLRRAVDADQALLDGDDIPGADTARDLDAERFPGPP